MRLAIAALIFVVALGVYLATMGAVPGFVDSGMLTLAAWSLGNAHPPGVPVYLLFTKLVTLLPIGTVALRANLASAIPAALCAALLALIVFEVRRADVSSARRNWADGTSALLAGLTFACSRTLWGYATIAEVYSLHFCLLAGLLLVLLVWQRTEDDRLLYLAGFLFGATLAIHHVTAGLMAFGFAAIVIGTLGVDVLRLRELRIAVVIAILTAALFYLYLPLRASAHPFWNWGDPDTPLRFWRHISGQEYRGYLTNTESGTQFRDLLHYLENEFAKPWLPLALLLALIGVVQLLRRQRVLFWFIALVIAADAMWVLVYTGANDKDAYVLPTFIAIAICCGVGTAVLVEWKRFFVALALIVPVIAFVSNLPYRGRGRARVVSEYTSNALRAMKPNALLLTNDINLFGPLLYLHEVERARPDIAIVETGLLIRRWYVDGLIRRYPDLMASVKKEHDAYRPHLERQEREPDAWETDVLYKEAFDAALDNLILAMIAKHGNAYITLDLTVSGPVGANLPQRLGEQYDIMPRGTLFELMPGHVLRPPDLTKIETGAILDPKIRYTDDDVAPKQLFPVYRAAFMLRGRHLAVLHEYKKAVAEYEKALVFDEGSMIVQDELKTLREAMPAMPR